MCYVSIFYALKISNEDNCLTPLPPFHPSSAYVIYEWSQRYRAVWRPIEYHNTVNSSPNPWRRVCFEYIIPVVLGSIIFNLPKFFETTFVQELQYKLEFDPIINTTLEVSWIHCTLLVLIDSGQKSIKTNSLHCMHLRSSQDPTTKS